MSAAAKVVKRGGAIVCAAECRDGLPSHGSYGQVLASRPSPEALLAMINAPDYSVPDRWQVQVQAQIQLKAQVFVKTRGLSLPTTGAFTLGIMLWLIYGLAIGDWPLIGSNAATLVLMAPVLALKLRYGQGELRSFSPKRRSRTAKKSYLPE